MAIHALINSRGTVTAKVPFDVAHHLIAVEFVRNRNVQTGKLRGGMKLGQVSLRRVAERYSCKVGGDVALGISGAEYVFQVHKPAES